LDWLRATDASLKVQAGQILLPNLAVDDLVVDILLEDGHLRADPFSCAIGGGSVDGRFDLRAQGQEATFDIELKIAQVNLRAMFEELGVKPFIEGTLGAQVEASGQGGSVAAWMAGLNGRITTVVSEGRLDNTSLDLIGGDLMDQVMRLVNPLSEREKYSELNCEVKDFELRDGIARLQVSVTDTKYTTVIGGGKIDLRRERLDLAFRLSPKKGFGIGGLGKIGLSLGKMAKAFKVSGTLANPSLAIDPRGTTVAVGKVAGAVALFGPAGIAAALIDVNVGGKHPCIEAMKAAEEGRIPEAKETEKEQEPEKKKGLLRKLFGR
jgi:hypothetical protein